MKTLWILAAAATFAACHNRSDEDMGAAPDRGDSTATSGYDTTATPSMKTDTTSTAQPTTPSSDTSMTQPTTPSAGYDTTSTSQPTAPSAGYDTTNANAGTDTVRVNSDSQQQQGDSALTSDSSPDSSSTQR